MSRLRPSFLGLAIADDRLHVAEAVHSGGQCTVRRCAMFPFPQGASLDAPAQLGAALGRFLRERNFTATRAVLGIPAGWCVSKSISLPAASPEDVADMVRLRAERAFATESSRLVTDCEPGAWQGRELRLLVAAMLRDRLAGLQSLAQAAGLRPMGVLPASLALAATVGADLSSGVLVVLGYDGVEMTVRSRGADCALHRAPLPPLPLGQEAEDPPEAWVEALRDSVQRMSVLMPAIGDETTDAHVLICDNLGMPEATLEDLCRPLGLPTEICAADTVLGLAEEGPGEECTSAAAALARLGAQGGELPLNFLRSRLTVRKPSRNGRRAAWAAVAGLIILGMVAACLVQWRRDEQQLAALRGRLEAMRADVEAADDLVERVTLVRGWTDRRPRFLEPLRELTLALPVEERIWITSLAIREDMRVVVTGKSADEKIVLGLLDRIRACPAFQEARLLYMREAESNGTRVAFSMAVNYGPRG